MKQNSSELSTTLLNEPKIAVFTGDAPLPTESPIFGELVPFSPLDGCRPLEFNTQFHTNSTKGTIEFKSLNNSTNFIVLLKKGKCSYATMIENASKVNHVVGVLIYDPNSSGFASLQVTSLDDLVPSLYISSTLGEDLLKKVNKYRESASADDNPWVRIALSYTPVRIDMAKGLQIFLIVVTISLVLSLIISMVWNYRIRNNLPSNEETPQPPPRRRPEQIPIDEDFLAKIPRRSYRSPNTSPVEFSPKITDTNYDGTMFDEDEDYRQRVPHNETCPICLDEFMYGTEINQLHCGHCYHPKCILPWLQNRSPLCPLCKIDVRVSLIEAEELAFVRSLRRLQRAKSTSAIENEALVKKMAVITEGGPLAGNAEMKEVYVVSAGSSLASLRARNASFDSIPLEAAISGHATPNRRHTDLT